jgi:hypothetical protein
VEKKAAAATNAPLVIAASNVSRRLTGRRVSSAISLNKSSVFNCQIPQSAIDARVLHCKGAGLLNIGTRNPDQQLVRHAADGKLEPAVSLRKAGRQHPSGFRSSLSMGRTVWTRLLPSSESLPTQDPAAASPAMAPARPGRSGAPFSIT